MSTPRISPSRVLLLTAAVFTIIGVLLAFDARAPYSDLARLPAVIGLVGLAAYWLLALRRR